MWLVIIIVVIAVLIFLNYNNDKKELGNSILSNGGLDIVFSNFIECISSNFKNYKIIKMTETEIEIFVESINGKNFVFANKLGFGQKVIYRCDTKRSNFLNAEIAVEGNISNQIQSFEMIINELIRKYSVEVSK